MTCEDCEKNVPREEYTKHRKDECSALKGVRDGTRAESRRAGRETAEKSCPRCNVAWEGSQTSFVSHIEACNGTMLDAGIELGNLAGSAGAEEQDDHRDQVFFMVNDEEADPPPPPPPPVDVIKPQLKETPYINKEEAMLRHWQMSENVTNQGMQTLIDILKHDEFNRRHLTSLRSISRIQADEEAAWKCKARFSEASVGETDFSFSSVKDAVLQRLAEPGVFERWLW